MAATQFALRVMILLVMAAIFLSCVAALWKRPERRVWAIAPGSWALHGVVFYGVVLGGLPFSPAALNLWSNALRLHVAILVMVGVWLFLWPARKRQ